MKVAILGYGTVGSGVYEIMEKIESGLITKILDRPENKNKLPIITDDMSEIINDDTITIVIETLGGIHPAYEYIMQSLKSGKHVVSANKAVIARYLNVFLETAKQNHVNFFFEASTGGGIPWIASILKVKRIDEIHSFSGIFNGTTNFILDEMHKNKIDFNEVLKIAQDLGYAEADPSADIDGYDIANKVMISTAMAFSTLCNVDEIPCIGIRHITKKDIAYFQNRKQCIKLIGKSLRLHNEYCVSVLPTIFHEKSIEANVSGNFNIASLHGTTIGDLKFYGQGAGKLPTANAVVQDIIDIQSGKQRNITFHSSLSLNFDLFTHRYIIRTNATLSKEYYTNKEDNYYETGYITLKQVMSIYHALKKKDEQTMLFQLQEKEG